ncbi:MAG: tetratricopeptide repeat protein [bacterium]
MRRLAVVAGLWLAGVPVAQADDFGPQRAQLKSARTAIDELEQQYLAAADLEHRHDVTARISDGQLFYLTRDYERASMVLDDVVEGPGAERHPGYRDALYYLADSLFHLRNFRAAGHRFDQVIEVGTRDQKQRALGRLLEIAVATRDEGAALTRLRQAQAMLGGDPDPALLYAVGKFHYRRDALNEAREAFSRVPPEHGEWYRARYHLGVLQVKERKFDEALATFAALIARGDVAGGLDDAQRAAVDEARLAIGRIHYERGEFAEAVAAYAAVPRESAAFDDALYESVWISIKQGEFEKALRKLEIQLIAQPDVIKGPDARLLQGKLLLMLGRHDQATKAFQEVLFEFEPMQAEMKTVIRRNNGDLVSHFNKVIGRGIAEFDLTSFLPARAAEFAGSDAEADRALMLVADLGAQKRDVEEMERTIRRLEVALAGRNRVEVFPKLAQGWLKASELRGRMLQIRGQILDEVARGLSEQPREYQALRQARVEASRRFAEIPTSAVAVMSREARVDDELRRLDTDLFKLDVAIRGLEAQLVAIDRYIEDQARSEGPKASDQRILAQVEIELTQARQLRTDLRTLADRLSLERIQIGIGDPASARDDRVRLDYLAAMEAELDWLRARGVALPMDLFSAARDVETRVTRFHRRAREHVDRKAGDYSGQLAREKANIAEYQRDLGDYQAQTETLGGAIAARSFLHVLGRIDGLVLEADVGLVDVAWKQKQDKSDQISRLLTRQADDLKALEQTWREVRGE